MLDKDHVAEIVERNPQVDPNTVERSRAVARRLARLGFKESGYRLEPALGGGFLRNQQADCAVRPADLEG